MKIDKPSSSSFSGEKKGKSEGEQPKNQNSSINKDKDGKEFATILEEKKKEQVIKDIFKLINKREVENEQEFTEFSRANGYDKKTYNECRTIYEGFGQRDRGNQEEKRREGETNSREGSLSTKSPSFERVSYTGLERGGGLYTRFRDNAKREHTNTKRTKPNLNNSKELFNTVKDAHNSPLKAYQDMQEFLDKDLNLSKTSSNLEKKNTLNNNTSNTNQLSNKDNITNNQTNNKDNPNQTINPSIKELSNTTNQNKDNPTKENKSIIKKSFKKDKSNNKDKGL